MKGPIYGCRFILETVHLGLTDAFYGCRVILKTVQLQRSKLVCGYHLLIKGMRRATFAVKNDFSEASPSGAHNGLLSRIKRSLVPHGMFPWGADTQAIRCPLGYFTLNLLECIHSFIELLCKENQQMHEACLFMLRYVKF